jgi:integrase
MATISKRKNKKGKLRYTVQIRHQERERDGRPAVLMTKTFSRRENADAWANAMESRVEQDASGLVNESDKHSLNDAIERYKRVKAPKLKDPHDHDTRLAWWSEHYGARTLSQIRPALISLAKEKLLSETFSRSKRPDAKAYPRSPATVNRYLASLSVVLSNCAGEWQWMQVSPLGAVDKLKESRGIVRMLSDAERKALHAACRQSANRMLHTIMTVALGTGARRSEVASLTWAQVDLKNGAAVIHNTKNDDRRTLHIHGQALEALQAHGKVRRIDTDLVFPSPGDPQRPYDFESAWQTALTRAKITDFRFHDLRHSAASYLAMDGASLNDIGEVLGHKTVQTTKRYTHLTKSHVSSAVKRMAEKMAKIDAEEAAPTEAATPASA